MIARAAPQAAVVARKLGRKAALAIVAGTDVQSRRFVQIKQRLLSHLQIQINPYWLDVASETTEALALIDSLNGRDDVDGIFLQFPLPEAIDAQVVADAVHPDKDIDCSGAVAEAQFEQGVTRYTPAAPASACQLLEDALGSVAGRHVVIYGREDAFARALRILLQRDGAAVSLIPTEADEVDVRDADALVVSQATPPAEALRATGRLAVILDAGYYLPPRSPWLAGTAVSQSCILLKQYGNVGPLTVANLACATVRAAELSVKR
jgi:methylenetetrahydrofolate dehydrogenase (NADP+)/methenyltetrahydrofolate cyclohydrolase